jgi:nitrate reductase NapA
VPSGNEVVGAFDKDLSRGDKVVLIDLATRTTRTSAFCDRSILFKPQTDLAIANGIAHSSIAVQG